VEEDIVLSVGAPPIAGQDRSMWRTLRPSAGQAQQWVSSNIAESLMQLLKSLTSAQRSVNGPLFHASVLTF